MSSHATHADVLHAAVRASSTHAAVGLVSAAAALAPPSLVALGCLGLGLAVQRGLGTPGHRWAARARLVAATALAIATAEGELLHALSLRLLAQLLLLLDALVSFGHGAAAACAAAREAAVGLGGRFEVRASKTTAPDAAPAHHADVGPAALEAPTSMTASMALAPPSLPPVPRLGTRWPSPPRRVSFQVPEPARGFRPVR